MPLYLQRFCTIPLYFRSITIRDMFEEPQGRFLRIIVEGKPGSGKTTLLKHCAVTWARGNFKPCKGKGFEEGRGNEDIALHQKDLVIFIDKRNEGESLEETIRNAIKGPNKEETFQFLKNNPERSFLFVDGLDEFLRKEVVNEIFKEAEDSCMNIIVCCRRGHPCLEKQMQKFNRHVIVEGFTEVDRQHFVHNFMAALNNDAEEDERSVQLKRSKRLCSFLSSKEAGTMYANPINCAFICILYNQGELTDDDLSTLSMEDLFVKQQALLLKRECIKRTQTEKEAGDLQRNAESSIKGIHRMALHSLIHQERKSAYSVEQAKSFGIDITSPAVVLLQEEFDPLEKGPPKKVFSWPHETIKEFQAASAATDATNGSIMYFIASRPELKEVFRFLFSTLIESDEESAKSLLTAKLFLRSTNPPCSKLKKGKTTRSEKGATDHPCLNILRLKAYWAEQNIDELLQKSGDPLEKPALNITEIQKCLAGTNWMLENMEILKELKECTSDCQSKDKGRNLLEEVVYGFLPSVYHGNLKTLKEKSPNLYEYIDPVIVDCPNAVDDQSNLSRRIGTM